MSVESLSASGPPLLGTRVPIYYLLVPPGVFLFVFLCVCCILLIAETFEIAETLCANWPPLLSTQVPRVQTLYLFVSLRYQGAQTLL